MSRRPPRPRPLSKGVLGTEISPATFVVVVLLLVATFALRAWAVGHARFTGDESYFWATALRIARLEAFPAYGPEITGGAAKAPGPLFHYLTAIPQLFGASPRLGGYFIALLHTLAAALFFHMARTLRGERAGIIALALVAFAPWDVLYGDRIWASCLAPVLGTIAVWATIAGHARPRWYAVMIVAALALPQVHLSAPLVWVACGTLLVLRPPPRIDKRALLVGSSVAAVIVLAPLLYDLAHGLENTRKIFGNAGGGAGEGALFEIPIKVFGYAVLYATDEIGYHFARGYWPPGFDDFAHYGSRAGWAQWLARRGPFWAVASALSLVVAIVAWLISLGRVVRASHRALRARSRSALSSDHALTLAVLAALVAGVMLLLVTGKLYFPHYANVLMPVLLWPVVSTLDQFLGRVGLRRWLVGLALVLGMAAMFRTTVQFYRTVDTLNGLDATVAMNAAVAAEDGPIHLSFTGYDNRYAWGWVQRLIHQRELQSHPRARIRYRVHNSALHDGPLEDHERRFGVVRVERFEEQPRHAVDVAFRARDRWRSGRAVLVRDDGTEAPCRASGPERCQYGEHPWQHYGPEIINVDGRPESLLFLHPIQGKRVRVRYPRVAGTRRGILRYALSDEATQSENTAPVEVRILLGDRPIAQGRAGNVPGLKSLEFPLSSTVSGDLAVEITAEKDGARVFGFDLELYRAR